MNTSAMPETADRIITLINRHIAMFDDFSEVYLFGSVLDNSGRFAEDVDLLLVYTELTDALIGAAKLIRKTLSQQIGKPIDLTILSFAEEQEVHFLDRLNARYYRIK